MFRNSYQGSWITLFYSGGSKPLKIWDTSIQGGYVTRFLDPELRSMVFEIRGNNVSTNYMVCPKGKQLLGINMPYMIMIIKNLHQCFCFQVTVRDDTNTKRRFRVANFQSFTQVLPYSTVMPICLENGWNQVIFNLADFTRRAYGKTFSEVDSIKINANIRIKRIYFTVKLFDDSDLPHEYRLYGPPSLKENKKLLESKDNKENEEPEPATPQQEEPQFIQEETPFPFPMMRRRSTTANPSNKDKKEEKKKGNEEEKKDDDQDVNKSDLRKTSSPIGRKKGQSLQSMTILKSGTSLISTDTHNYSHQHSLVEQLSPLRTPSAGTVPFRQPATTNHRENEAREEMEESAKNTAASCEKPVREEP